MMLISDLLTARYPNRRTLKKGAVFIGKVATVRDLNEGLSGVNPSKPNADKCNMLSNLVLDDEILMKAVNKVRLFNSFN